MYSFSVCLKEAKARSITSELEKIASTVQGECFMNVVADSSTVAMFICDSERSADNFIGELKNLFPARRCFSDLRTSPVHAAADVRAASVGKVLNLIAENGKLVLPAGQQVFAVDFEDDSEPNFKVYCR